MQKMYFFAIIFYFIVFQIKKAETFQVRRRSVIQPVSETVVTRTWLENAIRVYEDEQSVVLINMRFDRDKFGAYQAYVTAEVGIAYISVNRKLDFWIANSDCRIRIQKLVFWIRIWDSVLVYPNINFLIGWRI